MYSDIYMYPYWINPLIRIEKLWARTKYAPVKDLMASHSYFRNNYIHFFYVLASDKEDKLEKISPFFSIQMVLIMVTYLPILNCKLPSYEVSFPATFSLQDLPSAI